jgi:glycosyltransferase involved in cell wall biosynthesis
MDSIKVLVVLPEPPLPFGGAAARWYYVLLKGLEERGHRVTAFCPCKNSTEIDQARELFGKPRFDLRCYLYPQTSRIRSKWQTLRQPYSYVFGYEMRDELQKELAQGYDVLHLEQLWTGWLGPRCPRHTLINIHNLLSIDLANQRLSALNEHARHWLMINAESRLIRKFPNITTLTDRLKKRIREINPNSEVTTIPMALDLSLYQFKIPKPDPREPVVGLIGSFNWEPTRSAGTRLLTKLWPSIKQQVPNAKLMIVGRAAENLRTLGDMPDVFIHNDVPDTLPYFADAGVLLYAPSCGSGMKVKVMEAFALGVPVVTTHDGVEGLPAADGIHAGVCDDDLGLIERTVSLLRNPSTQDTLRLAGRKLLEQMCSPDLSIDSFERLYRKIMSQPHRLPQIQSPSTWRRLEDEH